MYSAKFLCALIFSCLSSAWSQNESSKPRHQHHLQIGIGYTQLYTKDLIFSPLNYSGNGLLYNLAYERQSKSGNNRFTLSAAFSSDDLKASTPNTINPIYIYADAGLSFTTRLFASKQSKTEYFLGAAYNTRAFYMDYDDQEAFSYTATHGLSILGVLEHQLSSKNWFRTSLSVPFVQLLARPPYNGIDAFIIENQDNVAQILFSGKLASFDRFQAFFWKTDYYHAVSRFFDVGLRYDLGYQKTTQPVKAILWQHQLLTCVRLTF